MATKSSFRPSAARPARKPAKKFEVFHHSSELAPKTLRVQASVQIDGGRTVEVSYLSDEYWVARALVQLVARHVPAAITTEQALPLIYDVFSVYEPARDHEYDEWERGYGAGRLYCRLSQRELADLVQAAVPDAPILLPRPLYGCPM